MFRNLVVTFHRRWHYIFFYCTYKLRPQVSKRVSLLKTYVLIFCGFFIPMNFIVFVINQTVFQHMQRLLPPALFFHRPPQRRCFPCISNPLCTLHKICLLLSIRNKIRLESLFLQAKILLTPNHHEGVLRDVKVKLRILSLDTMARCAVCFTLLLGTHEGPYAHSWLQYWRDTRASRWMTAVRKKPKSLQMMSSRQVSGP